MHASVSDSLCLSTVLVRDEDSCTAVGVTILRRAIGVDRDGEGFVILANGPCFVLSVDPLALQRGYGTLFPQLT